jgi:ribosomal-protein-alanine N-acetyltransferase
MRYPSDVPELSDGRVTLRAHRVEDVEAMVEQCRDPEMQRFTTVPVPYTRADAEAFVGSRASAWQDGTRCSFVIETAEGIGASHFAGSIGLHGVTPEGLAEVGYGLHPALRGRGVTTAALGLLLDWAFAEGGIERVGWQCIPGNLGSWRVAWRNGFTFDGPRRHAHAQRGELGDSWTGSLLATDTREPKNRGLPTPRLESERVVLRGVRPDDEARMLQTATDPETHQWLHMIPFAREHAAFELRLAHDGLGASLGHSVEYVMADPATDEFVGAINLFDLRGLDHRSAEVGYRTHPSARGRGYTSAALRLLTGLAFGAEDDGGFGLQRIRLGAAGGNVGSQAVARSAGFTETGRDRHCYLLADGTVDDLVRFDLLRTDPPRRHT